MPRRTGPVRRPLSRRSLSTQLRPSTESDRSVSVSLPEGLGWYQASLSTHSLDTRSRVLVSPRRGCRLYLGGSGSLVLRL